MKTIIYIGGFELPNKNAAAQRVVANAKVLKTIGFDVILIDINRDCNKEILETKAICFGFTRYSMKYTVSRLISIRDFKKVFITYKGSIQCVIAYNYPGIALYRMKKICNNNNVKIYADCTEWYGSLGDNIIKRYLKGFDSYLRMNLVQPKLDGIIAISKYIYNFYKDSLPTIYIPPLTDLSESKWRQDFVSDHSGIEVVYAGNPGKHKDKINKIIESIGKIKKRGIHFTVIGISKNVFLNYYPEDAEILQTIGNLVTFKGRIPHNEVICYLKKADFSMFYREKTRVTMAGFPTKFSESITCGTPVITNRTSDIENYLIDGINGFLVNELDASELESIFNKGEIELKKVKHTVDNSMFDYHNYIREFEMMFFQ